MAQDLKEHIKAVVDGIRDMRVDDAADMLAEIGDEMSVGDKTDDMIVGAILDGIRWGYEAAVVVESCGGALARFIMPGGCGVTMHWSDSKKADPAIKAAIAAITDARSGASVKASGVGDD